MNPKNLLTEVPQIFTDINNKIEVLQITLNDAVNWINQLRDENAELTNSNEELREVIRDILTR
jgi:regulator of replication initiation timing